MLKVLGAIAVTCGAVGTIVSVHGSFVAAFFCLTVFGGSEALLLMSGRINADERGIVVLRLLSIGRAEWTATTGVEYGSSFQDLPTAIDPFEALERTEAFWRDWNKRSPDVGPWTEEVRRSLITLKALTYAPTGGIVAAATTSLPERLGGVRNWDYRYCWLRDATFTLLAFMQREVLAGTDW
jgi:Glycosyl hydrolases family 15